MATKIVQVDSFTSKPFRGNAAGVCFLDRPAEEAWMQNVAAEINLSETAFFYREGNVFNLRWFTPKKEVDLCGHATLASAHVLWEDGVCKSDETITFQSLSGPLRATKKGNRIELDFPAEPEEECDFRRELSEIVGANIVYSGKNRMDYLGEVESEEVLRKLAPDFEKMKKISTRGVLITAKSERKEYDFISRCFFPTFGIDEDPVTGSAHCCLGPYWKKRLGKSDLRAFQSSERGGELGVRMEGDRVFLSGEAVTVLRCELVDE